MYNSSKCNKMFKLKQYYEKHINKKKLKQTNPKYLLL